MRDLEFQQPVSPARFQRNDITIGIELASPVGMILLRVDLADPKARSLVASVTGCTPPDALRMESSGERSLLWMSTDELLLMCGKGEVAGMLESAAQSFAGMHHAAVDVSDAWVCYRLTGNGVREVLSKGAPADMHKEAFRLGMVRRTRIGQVAVVICQTDDVEERFDILCRRSYAPYLSEWLLESASDCSNSASV